MGVFAIDAGGTRIKLGLVESGKVVARTWLDARAEKGFAAALPRIETALRSLTSDRVDGVGLAFPSLIDGDRIVGDVGKYRDAERLDLASWSRQTFGARFAVDNDARLAAIGEWRYGAGRGAMDLVMITLGTGIGTGVISEGRVLRGRHGAAGILGGHMTAKVGGTSCPCGNAGCWETEASTAALSKMNGDFQSYAEVFASSEPSARTLRERSLAVWGALAVSLIHAYDPEILVFGGGVLASGEAVLGPIRDTVQKHAWTPWGNTRIVASELGDDAALAGCEWLLRERR